MFHEPVRRRIYLMRHGEAAYFQSDGQVTNSPRQAGLTEAGRAQAAAQGRMLADIKFDRAICSGLVRTRETAAIVLGERRQPELEIHPELEEIRGHRALHGRPQPVDRNDPDGWLGRIANPWAEKAFLDGESFDDFAERIIPAFEQIVKDDDWQSLLLVLHDGVNRMILNHILGLPWQRHASIEQDYCGLNIIDVDSKPYPRFLVRATNLTAFNLTKAGIHLTTMEHTARRLAAHLVND